jgi:RNA polymerase sigma-70 factor, ECF subfamily
MLSAGCIIRSMDLEQERTLIERAKYSKDAFGELYDMHYDTVLGYAFRRTADIEVAQDVTSAVFFKVLEKIQNYQWQGIPFSHWLYRIANREIVNQYDKKKLEISQVQKLSRNSETLNSQNEPAFHVKTEQNEDYIDLQRCISRIPSKYQEVIALKYFEDKETREIAGILNKPEGTVKSLLHRGIEQLRKMMTDEGMR